MAMDQEVDVKLFITCRLCLDEPGSYQIVPCIKDQIEFCFGIDIDPFDGLPQLICKKCKSILSEYYATKNKFVEKQKNLHSNLPIDNNAHPLIDLESAELPTDADAAFHCNAEKSVETADPASRGNCVESAEDAKTVPQSNSVKPPDTEDVVPNSKSKKKIASWKKGFNKHFLCAICDKSFLTEKSVKRHSPSHKKILTKHEKIFRNYVMVQLNKIDRKKNFTGGLRNVVYNKNKIICVRRNTRYHSIYLKKISNDDKIDENENVAAKKPLELSDDDIGKGKKRKCRRLFSTSSTETVVLENNKRSAELDNREDQNNPTLTDNPAYIHVDDTSSDCPRANAALEKKRILPKRHQVKAEVGDYKAIQNIVTMCNKNYIKKMQNSDTLNKSTFSASSLKHKVLSLGRKVINKQGFSSTGLLRYMEHKDLDITWTPTSNDMQKKAPNFVRILSKLKSREDSENDDASWKKLHDISFCSDNEVEARVTAASEVVRSDDQASLPPALVDEDPALANGTCEPNDLNYRNKLLNKTPVANPKQLPKKINTPETKPIIIKADAPTFIPPNIAVSDALENVYADEDINMCLPIITSTTSLSAQVTEIAKQEVPVVEKPAPRIKVKPASELMSAKALNYQETVEDIWRFNAVQSSLPQHLANAAVAVDAPMSEAPGGFISSQPPSCDIVAYQNDPLSQIGENNHKDEPSRNLEYIILDTPTFPNNKTKTPFKYFQKVLQVYGLKLLELNEDLPQQFNCLIKFKLMLKQDSKRPIGVLLSLFCSKDTFCFSFKDTNSKKFDPNQLPAFWQWELLKIYKGDVGCRILQNALKVGKDVHKCTDLFLSLLKSIRLVTES